MTYPQAEHDSSRLKDAARTPVERASHVAIEDHRRHNFLIVQNVVIDEYLAKIGPYAFAVYCYLVRRAGQMCSSYPSIPRIAKDCGMNEKTVRGALQKLTDENLIAVKIRYSDHGDRDSNRYSILQP